MSFVPSGFVAACSPSQTDTLTPRHSHVCVTLLFRLLRFWQQRAYLSQMPVCAGAWTGPAAASSTARPHLDGPLISAFQHPNSQQNRATAHLTSILLCGGWACLGRLAPRMWVSVGPTDRTNAKIAHHADPAMLQANHQPQRPPYTTARIRTLRNLGAFHRDFFPNQHVGT